MHINTFWIALSPACDTPHVAAALQEYCISFHCLLVNQDFPTAHDSREEKRQRDCQCVAWQISHLKCRKTIVSSSISLITLLCSEKVAKKVAEIKGRDWEWCQEWSNDQPRSDGLRLFSDLPPNSERSSFQHLTPSLKEDNDGWESSSHKAALSAHRGRCGDVVTGKAGCVSKQELPALCIAALALQWYYSHPHLTSPLTTPCLSLLSLPVSLLLLLLSLFPSLFLFFYTDSSFPYSTWNNIKNTIQKALNSNSRCQVILSAAVVLLCCTNMILTRADFMGT